MIKVSEHPFLVLIPIEPEAGLNAAEDTISHMFTNIEIRRRSRLQEGLV